MEAITKKKYIFVFNKKKESIEMDKEKEKLEGSNYDIKINEEPENPHFDIEKKNDHELTLEGYEKDGKRAKVLE
jgi:hypothetical protein